MSWFYDDNGDQTWVPDADTDIYAPPEDDGTTRGINTQIGNLNEFWKSIDPKKIMEWLGPTGSAIGIQGIASLLNSAMKGDPIPKAYPGGIPNLVASRQMLPIPPSTTNYVAPAGGAAPAMAPRRPGSGGVTYFTPMTYAPPTPPTNTTTTTTTDATVPGSTGLTPPGTVAPVNDVGPGGYARGGLTALGYAKGRLLNGPGDGVSDSIPATIDGSQPAALADGEYVIPARIVSELGNGSTKAGAKKLDAMMKRIQASRRRATDIAANTRVDKHLPA